MQVVDCSRHGNAQRNTCLPRNTSALYLACCLLLHMALKIVAQQQYKNSHDTSMADKEALMEHERAANGCINQEISTHRGQVAAHQVCVVCDRCVTVGPTPHTPDVRPPGRDESKFPGKCARSPPANAQ